MIVLLKNFELYDLINDPNEKNNIIKENIPIASRI